MSERIEINSFKINNQKQGIRMLKVTTLTITFFQHELLIQQSTQLQQKFVHKSTHENR